MGGYFPRQQAMLGRWLASALNVICTKTGAFVKIVIIYTWKIAFVYICFIRPLLLEGNIRNVANESQISRYISLPK